MSLKELPNRPRIPAKEEYQRILEHVSEELFELRLAHRDRDFLGIADALCDLIYVVNQYACMIGLDLEPFYNEIHRTNMEKIGPDGPIVDASGKVQKPKGWLPPKLHPILEKQQAEFSMYETGRTRDDGESTRRTTGIEARRQAMATEQNNERDKE